MREPPSTKSSPRSLRISVRSRDLPGFRALTCELDQYRAQLETQGLLPEGTALTLHLEFDRQEIQDFSCPARVDWAREVPGERDFRIGVSFLPEDDAKRATLARMATVLRTRSESDLDSLLEEAKRLCPERARIFLERRTKERVGPKKAKQAPALGALIPLEICIDRYQWEGLERVLRLFFSDAGGVRHSLCFPHCRLLTDYGCVLRPGVTGLYCTPFSETIGRLADPAPRGGWKHYRFLMADRQPILELVSAPCCPGPAASTASC